MGDGARPRVLLLGQAYRPTGFSRVVAAVAGQLAPRSELLLFAFTHRRPATGDGFLVRPNLQPGDPYGRDQLPAVLEGFAPDAVLLYHDVWFYSVHEEALSRYRATHPGARVVVYCPIEWESLTAPQIGSLAGADALVLFAPFARRLVARRFAQLGAPPPPLHVIPHGVDTGCFRPLAPGSRERSRREARRRLWPDRPELADAFVVLNANRNVPRKRIDATMAGFAAFARGRTDAYLHLHTGMRDAGCDVVALASSLGIEDRLLVSTRDGDHPAWPDDRLNVVYNAADVGLNTSTGEGWGMVAFEHGASGAAQVLPDHSACADLWAGRALLMPCREDAHGAMIVAGHDVASALQRLYDDPELRRSLGTRAFELSTSDHLRWDRIATAWLTVLAPGRHPPA